MKIKFPHKYLFLAGFIFVAVFFQNCAPSNSDNLFLQMDPIFTGTDTGNAMTLRRRFIAADSLVGALCGHAQTCIRDFDFELCVEDHMALLGLPEKFGVPELRNFNDVKEEEMKGALKSNLNRAFDCIDDILDQSCRALKRYSRESLEDQSYQAIHSWISGSCSSVYSSKRNGDHGKD